LYLLIKTPATELTELTVTTALNTNYNFRLFSNLVGVTDAIDKNDFDLNIFNGRPLAALARLTQTISGRRGRISFPLPFGQI